MKFFWDRAQQEQSRCIVRELGIESMLRDSILSTIFSGFLEIQREIIASKLGL